MSHLTNVKKLLSQKDLEALREGFQKLQDSKGNIGVQDLRSLTNSLYLELRSPAFGDLYDYFMCDQTFYEKGVRYDTYLNGLEYFLGEYNTANGLNKVFDSVCEDPNSLEPCMTHVLNLRKDLRLVEFTQEALNNYFAKLINGEIDLSFTDFYMTMTRRTFS